MDLLTDSRLATLRVMSDIGIRLRQARKASGLAQEELARRIGMSVITVSRWETGKIKNPGSAELSKLARELGVSERWLSSGDAAPAPSATPDPPQWAEFLRRYEHLAELTPEQVEDVKGFAARNLPTRSWTDYERVAEMIRGAQPSPTFEAKKKARRAAG